MVEVTRRSSYDLPSFASVTRPPDEQHQRRRSRHDADGRPTDTTSDRHLRDHENRRAERDREQDESTQKRRAPDEKATAHRRGSPQLDRQQRELGDDQQTRGVERRLGVESRSVLPKRQTADVRSAQPGDGDQDPRAFRGEECTDEDREREAAERDQRQAVPLRVQPGRSHEPQPHDNRGRSRPYARECRA